MALKDFGDQVNFSYFPVHNWNSTGGYACSYTESGVVHSLDCESTRYDGCMAAHYCWTSSGCDQATQLRIANFLQCFEGSYANTEVNVNSSRRQPCFSEAGLDFAPVQQCYDDTSLADSIESRLNASKGAMMASLGSNPGTFPHIFIDGKHQWNYSWCALTRTLCGLVDDKPAACEPTALELSFVVSSSILPDVSALSSDKISQVIQAAVGLATSASALPNNFDAADPKYVDVAPVEGANIPRVKPSGTVTIEVKILNTFVDFALAGVQSKRFRDGLAQGFQTAGVAKATASDISDVKIARAGIVTIV